MLIGSLQYFMGNKKGKTSTSLALNERYFYRFLNRVAQARESKLSDFHRRNHIVLV